jgi:hypothetical protein
MASAILSVASMFIKIEFFLLSFLLLAPDGQLTNKTDDLKEFMTEVTAAIKEKEFVKLETFFSRESYEILAADVISELVEIISASDADLNDHSLAQELLSVKSELQKILQKYKIQPNFFEKTRMRSSDQVIDGVSLEFVSELRHHMGDQFSHFISDCINSLLSVDLGYLEGWRLDLAYLEGSYEIIEHLGLPKVNFVNDGKDEIWFSQTLKTKNGGEVSRTARLLRLFGRWKFDGGQIIVTR